MCKAIFFSGFVFGLLACGNPPEKNDTDRLDLSDPRTTSEIGKVLYLRYCLHCHAALQSDNMQTYSIKSAKGDWGDLQKFVRSQDSLLKAGDLYTIELNQKWGQQPYRHSFNLSDAELNALFYYLGTTF